MMMAIGTANTKSRGSSYFVVLTETYLWIKGLLSQLHTLNFRNDSCTIHSSVKQLVAEATH